MTLSITPLYHYAKYRDLLVIMLNFVMLNVIMPYIQHKAIQHNETKLNDTQLKGQSHLLLSVYMTFSINDTQHK
jgi:hypothetical protein